MAKVGTRKWKHQQKIRWSALLSIEEMVPRRGRYGRYVVLYTNANITVCCGEELANKLCLFEPFEMKGEVQQYHGGTYLKLSNATYFDPASFHKREIRGTRVKETGAGHFDEE